MLDLGLALGMALLCFLFHFEALDFVERMVVTIKSARLSLLASWSGLFAAHIIEIWFYALAYYLCDLFGVGTLYGLTSSLDYVYFSAVVYTTLGFGDIVPDDGIQMLAGSEALVGLCLIAWSASVTYTRVLTHRNRNIPP